MLQIKFIFVLDSKVFMILRVIIIIFLLVPFLIYSQNCDFELSIQVLDHHDDDGLEFATVFIQELAKGDITHDDGKVSFTMLCAGEYHLIVSHIGCATQTLFIDLKKNEQLTIYLEHHETLLEEVEIKSISSQNKIGLSKSSIGKELLLELKGKNLSDVLLTVPGVSALRTGPGLAKPIIHGMYGNRVTILNHGIPQEGQQWGNDHTPEIDPNTADKISVVKGSSAIRYGLQAMGGLIILEPSLLKYEPHLHGDIQVNTQSNGRQYGLNTSLTKSNTLGSMKLTAGFQRSGDRKSPEYYLTNTGNKENSISLLLTNDAGKKHYRKVYYSYYGTEIGILRGSHIGNLTDLQEAFIRKVPFYTQDNYSAIIDAPRQNVHHQLLKYGHVLRYSEQNVLHLDLALQANNRQEFDVRRAKARDNPSLDLTLISTFLDANFTHSSASGEIEHVLGFQNKYSNNTNNPGTGISPLIPDFIGYQNALYYILKTQVWHTPLEFGLRSEFRNYDIYEINQSSNVEQTKNTFLNFAANVGIRKEITKELRTQFDISFSSRPPEVNELYSKGLHQGVSGIEEGNRNLVSEFSTKIVNEWIGHVSDKLYINASLFYNKLENFIYLLPSREERLTIRGAFPVFRYASTDVTMMGLSIKSTYQMSSTISLSNQINIIRARNNTSNNGLIWTPPPNVALQLAVNAPKSKWFQELKSGLEVNYTFKQTNVDIAEDLVAPPDGYFLVNLFAKIKWKKKYGNDIHVVVRSENLMNVVYRDYLNRIRYFADEIGRNISISIGTSF